MLILKNKINTKNMNKLPLEPVSDRFVKKETEFKNQYKQTAAKILKGSQIDKVLC